MRLEGVGHARRSTGQGYICSTMGWEQRGIQKYYYRKVRESSRVKSIYVGRGELAELTARLEAMQRDTQKRNALKTAPY